MKRRLTIPVKIKHFILLSLGVLVLALIPVLRKHDVGEEQVFAAFELGGDRQREHKARELLEEMIAGSTENVNTLPRETVLVGVKVTGESVTVDLGFPTDYNESGLDAAGSDAINRMVVDTLLPLGLRKYKVRAAGENGYLMPLSDLLPEVKFSSQSFPANNDPVPSIPGPMPGTPGAPPLTSGSQPEGVLSGKTVWLSAGHGWVWTGIRWITQRPNTHGIVEDFANSETVNYFLARYLWNAGADVWLVREPSNNEFEIIVDNDHGSPGYTESGQFNTSSSSGYDGGSYRYALSEINESATATWRPDIPEPGMYPVWVWFRHNTNRAVDTRYQIRHTGGITDVSISQEVHGDTWHYLGEFYFETGTGGYVALTNQSSDAGQAVVADAVRFGGGMGSIDRGQGVSGKPRWEEAARYYAQYMGFPMDESINDVIVRPMYAEWEKSKGYPGEDGVFISWHTNCCNNSGTLSFIHSFQPTPGSEELQSIVHNELVDVLRSDWDKDWQDRGQLSADFGEVRELSTMPGVLLEIAYHDTEYPGDADDLKEPRFRQLTGRAVYQGIVKYFADKDGVPAVMLPQPPTHLTARNDAPDGAVLSWQSPPAGDTTGGEAESYRVYMSDNGRGFDNGVVTSDPFITIPDLKPGSLNFFKVTAINKGGESFPSQVAAVAAPRSGNKVPFLIVNGFDRLDKDSMLRQGDDPLDSVYRMRLEQMNRRDYIVEHAQALHSCGYAFDSTLNEAIEDGTVELDDYAALDWFVGEDAQVDKSLSKTERAALRRYLDSGGDLLISGSEIGWDLARSGDGVDASFYNLYLKSEYVGNDAATYQFNGQAGGLFENLSGSFDDGSEGYYDVDQPDRLAANGGSEAVLEYQERHADAAAIAYQGDYDLVYFGFPLETVFDPELRDQLICQAAEYLIGPTGLDLFMPVMLVDN